MIRDLTTVLLSAVGFIAMMVIFKKLGQLADLLGIDGTISKWLFLWLGFLLISLSGAFLARVVQRRWKRKVCAETTESDSSRPS